MTFTYIFDKGKSVVDYMITPQDSYNQYLSFKVHSMNKISEKYNIAQCSLQTCKVLNHSILQLVILPISFLRKFCKMKSQQIIQTKKISV